MRRSKHKFHAIINGRLKDHIRAGFLMEMVILSDILPDTVTRAGTIYTCYYETFPDKLEDETIIRCIASFQQHHDGSNIVVIRPYNLKYKG